MMTSNAAVPAGETISEPVHADVLTDVHVHVDTVKMSWGSIFAGLIVALGAWILLSVLGLAIGLSSIDLNQQASLRSAGMVSGIWSLVVPFVALLVGGLVASRTAGVVSRPTGAIHGVVLWALATIASLALVGYVARGVISTAMGVSSDDGSMANGSDQPRRDLDIGSARASDTTAKAMWWVFLGMMIGLGSSVAGATLGVSRRQRSAAAPVYLPSHTGTPAHV
jgi:hypothetical protein